MGQVRVGFFHNFKSSDTLLLDGDSDGLRSLSRIFRQLAETSTPVALHELPFVDIHHRLQIHASRSDRDAGAAFREGAGIIVWMLPKSAWESAADKVDVLTREGSGHQYLDDLSDITVMASTGEYGELWWQKRG